MESENKHIAKSVNIMPFPYRVDIVIPYHGQYEKVTRLIESIFLFTMSNVYKIILVDDCSPNKSFGNDLSKNPGIISIRTPQHLGFGGACEYGFNKSQELDKILKTENKPQHPFVVFIQSDCLIENMNWLRNLGETLLNLKPEGVRMVSPMTDNPMGGDPRQKRDRHDTYHDIILDEGNLSLYCFMCHRELFSHIGGFIKNYPFGWYEDEELALRMKHYGFKQAIVGRSWIKHYGQVTIRDLWREKPETRKIMTEDNRKKCIQDIRKLLNT